MPGPEHLTKEQFEEYVDAWLTHAEEAHVEYYSNSQKNVTDRIIAAGMADERSIAEGMPAFRAITRRYVLPIVQGLVEKNKDRLVTLAALLGKTAAELKGYTVVSIGGGPGDKLCEPWIPRLAGVLGANAINFDMSSPLELDEKQNLFKHYGGGEGDVFNILLHSNKMIEVLGGDPKIAIIECNNMIGNNVSPEIGFALGALADLPKHPKVIALRKVLREAALLLLMEGGILAIDDVYYRKVGVELKWIDEKGSERTTPGFIEEESKNE